MKFWTLSLCALIVFSAPAFAQLNSAAPTAEIDFQAFLKLSQDVEAYRKDRLISKNAFFDMADEPETVILDTRSREAYDAGHINGAIHLNFSDFTKPKLKKILGDEDVRILIYCNNNFINNAPPFEKKAVELALNVPTFINLYGYGYKNIYELKDGVDMHDPAMRIVTSQQQ